MSKSLHNAAKLTVDFVLYQHIEEINQLSIEVKVLFIPFPRFSCLVLFQGHVTFPEKNQITKLLQYFVFFANGNAQTRVTVGFTTSNKTAWEDNYSSIVQQFYWLSELAVP